MGEGSKNIIGKKLRMTQVFDDLGNRIPVTVILAGPCAVLQVKTTEKDGYSALQVGFGDGSRKVPKALAGHLKKAKRPRLIREIPHPGGDVETGSEITLGAFEGVERVDVSGISKGRGFSGSIKRWGLSRGPASHGSKNVRMMGSTGMGTDPGRVFKGRPMPGQYGNARVTVKNLRVVRLEKESNLLFVRGAVPGPSGGLLMIRESHGG
ncbi:MAG: 50S ribosomal protein L3 [Planctomycetota bacterium]|nr:50S ribosomal protein L3 [Planctomycetota bacterium]